MGNLTYDGTYISGDGRTYLGLDTIASWDYQSTFDATQAGGSYADFRIANTADADFFIGSLFGAEPYDCSAAGSPLGGFCGTLLGWSHAYFGNSNGMGQDSFFFTSDEDPGLSVGHVRILSHGLMYLHPAWGSIGLSDEFSEHGSRPWRDVPWLLVMDTVASVPEPSILALMGLGIFGIGFARRRRQS
jgi:hypothetical protein